MAPSKRAGKGKAKSSLVTHGSPPEPFKRPPDVLDSFTSRLSQKHVYITHIDAHPVPFKRKIFLVPVAMNVCVVVLLVWRMYAALPWYWKLIVTAFGHQNETSFFSADAEWSELGWEIGKRVAVMLMDFLLFFFLWPWPVQFALGQAHGSPVLWRWNVGFREKEVYVRRSRNWDKAVGNVSKDEDSLKIVMAHINQATSPLVQEQKTGYLLIGKYWDLDWDAMVQAHTMVDKKEIALEAFRTIVLLHDQDYGWLCYDLKAAASADEDEKRRQVFLFRDALTSMGKEDLFYRWVEVVQYEATQPGGFGLEKQAAAAKKIRELFEESGVDFDEVWKEAVGTTGGQVF